MRELKLFIQPVVLEALLDGDNLLVPDTLHLSLGHPVSVHDDAVGQSSIFYVFILCFRQKTSNFAFGKKSST